MHESTHRWQASAASAALIGILTSSPLLAQNTFPSRIWPTSGSPNALAIADFNADGRPDLASASNPGASLGVLRSLGRGLFQPQASQALGFNPTSLGAADF